MSQQDLIMDFPRELSDQGFAWTNEEAMRKILLILFTLLNTTMAHADTMQRLEVVGTNDSGSLLAVIASHFGPSSYAPFVELRLYDTDRAMPEVLDRMSQFQGDEASIAEMRNLLLQKNADRLRNLSIVETFKIIPLNSMTTVADAQTLVEFDDYENGEFQRLNFSLYEESSSDCASAKGMKLRVCKLSSPVHCLEPVLDTFSKCSSQILKFSRAEKINGTNWFFFFLQTEPLEDMFFFTQMAIGGI